MCIFNFGQRLQEDIVHRRFGKDGAESLLINGIGNVFHIVPYEDAYFFCPGNMKIMTDFMTELRSADRKRFLFFYVYSSDHMLTFLHYVTHVRGVRMTSGRMRPLYSMCIIIKENQTREKEYPPGR